MMTKSKFRQLIFFKLPIAWVAGLRLGKFTEKECEIHVKLSRWSTNPFRSMFWAVQGMAAEMTTGLLCMMKINARKQRIAMLVLEQNGTFSKKARGKITFRCEQGHELDALIEKAIETKEAQTLKVHSIGTDESGDEVARFWFLWSLKVRASN